MRLKIVTSFVVLIGIGYIMHGFQSGNPGGLIIGLPLIGGGLIYLVSGAKPREGSELEQNQDSPREQDTEWDIIDKVSRIKLNPKVAILLLFIVGAILTIGIEEIQLRLSP